MTIAKSTLDSAVEMYASGVSTEQIAKSLGISKSSVRIFARRARIKPTNQVADATIEQVVKLYCDGLPLKDIATRTSIAVETVRRIVAKNSIPVRVPRHTDSVKDKAFDLYGKGLGITRIAEMLNISTTPIFFWFKNRGILRNRQEAAEIKIAQHKLQWGALTPARAWVLGLIYGDGGITKTMRGVSLTVEDRDEDVLDKVACILGTTPKVTRRNRCVRIDISSTRFARLLRDSYGLDHDKCANMTWPALPPDCIRHFIRGLIDSDGSWYAMSGRSSHLMAFAYASISIPFVQSLNETIISMVDVSIRDIRIQKNKVSFIDTRKLESREIAVAEYSHLDAISIGRWVYAGDTETMRGNRKYEFWRQYSDVHIKPQWLLRHERHKAKQRLLRVP